MRWPLFIGMALLDWLGIAMTCMAKEARDVGKALEQGLPAARKQVEELSIKVPDISASVNSLSGGNQQKVVVGNWLNTQPQIMLYDEPSRGIDVSAKQQIFEIIWDQSRSGVSTIVISSELEELLEVCHRILIMKEGRLIGEVRPENVNINQLYALSMGDELQ